MLRANPGNCSRLFLFGQTSTQKPQQSRIHPNSTGEITTEKSSAKTTAFGVATNPTCIHSGDTLLLKAKQSGEFRIGR
jgi:hypothetical protein